jgi:hypothetical protein
MQKHRISTNIGKDQKVTVELKQDYELLEILSLKFSQKEAYASYCSDYGVVCGRISVNNGLGIPNARVSIFIPLKDEHKNDPVIKALYPYESIEDSNEDGYRYNLLPKRQQHGGHEPTGTFFDQTDILTREEVLEVFETYYSYTVKTNSAGDFMIWGVPLGNQTIHVDVDLSDIGAFSLRPYDFIKQGKGLDSFKNKYKFKSSEDFKNLPQIVSFDKTIQVYPFWGNEDYCEIGITRTDFDLSSRGVKIQPKAYIIGGVYTDSGKNAINKNCVPRSKMGRKCDLIAKSATVELIRFTTAKETLPNGKIAPILEQFNLNEDIGDDGGFVIPLEMNMDYMYTNEFGENEITNDPNKGIPTSACYRTRININDNDLTRVRMNADFLLPNVREYGEYVNGVWIIDDESYAWSLDWTDYPTASVSDDPSLGILYSENGEYYPRDYFYRFNYNKVYTVSSFQSSYHNDYGAYTKDRFIGLKELVPTEEEDCADNLTPPVNFGLKNYTFTLLIADVLLFAEHLINLLTLTFTNALVKLLFVIGDAADFRPIRTLARSIKRAAFRAQENAQRRLYLINYPECEECNGENTFGVQLNSGGLAGVHCSVGSATITGDYLENSRTLAVTAISFSADNVGECPGELIDIVYFISHQSDYMISSTRYGDLVLTNEFSGTAQYNGGTVTGYTNITFQDDSAFFSEPGSFTVTLRSATDTQSGDTTTTIAAEEGCDIYDTPYDEDIATYYYIGPSRTKTLPIDYVPGSDVTATNLSGDNGLLDYWSSSLSDSIAYYPNAGVPLVSVWEGETHELYTPSGQSEFQNGIFTIVPGAQTTARVWEILREYRRRKRVGKMFCGGIVNYAFIDNWLSGSLYFFQFKAKRVTDAINQGNEDIIKYCRDVVRFVKSQGRFYYRSTKFNGTTFVPVNPNQSFGSSSSYKRIGTPTTFVDLGPRDEFIREITTDSTLDVNSAVARSIGASSFQSFGEIMGLAINYRMDVSNNEYSVGDFFTNTGYSAIALYDALDGDILQLISMNNEAGIEQFDLQNPKYLGYSYQVLDPDLYPQVFNTNGYWGPVPITLEFSEDGERIRASLNEPGRLTESSQIVPFYLWDKKGTGFGGTSQDSSDDQAWDYANIVSTLPLQGMTTGYSYNGTYDDPTDKYLLLPITYDFSGQTITGNTTDQIEFDDVITGKTSTGATIPVATLLQDYNNQYPGYTVLSVTGGTLTNPTSGTLYTRRGAAGNDGVVGWAPMAWNSNIDFIIRPTADYYSGTTKQILSTPFQFYFGLKAGKTGLDKFVDLFGPKGAFPPAE